MKKCQAIHEISRKVIVELSSQESFVVPTPEASVIDVESNNEPTQSTSRIEYISDQERRNVDQNDNLEKIVEEEEDENPTTPGLAKVDLRHMLKSKHFFQSHSTEVMDAQPSLELVEKDEEAIQVVNKEVIKMKVINEVETRTEKKKSCVIFKDETKSETKIAGVTVMDQKVGNIFISTQEESKVSTGLATSSHSIREKDKILDQKEDTTVLQNTKERQIGEDITIEYLNEGYELRRRRSKKLGASEAETEGVPIQKVIIDQFYKKPEKELEETKSRTINRPTYSGDNLFHGIQKGNVASLHLIPSSHFIEENLRTGQRGKEQMLELGGMETEQKDEDRVKAGEGVKTEYFNKEYEVRHQESEKLVGEKVLTQEETDTCADTDYTSKFEFKPPATRSGTIINRLIYPEIFLFRKKRKNVTKNAPFKEVDVQTDEPSIQTYVEDKTEFCHLHTGRFEDGQRRCDLVLVMTATEDAVVENMKLNFFIGVVKAGIQVECELGKLYKHKHLQFVKLYATDALLEGYAGVLGVHRCFRRYHEDLIYNRNLFMKKMRCCSTLYEKEILQSVRSRYVAPLLYSNLNRSYIIYMVLNKQTFGPHRNHCGLQILLDRKIILDAFPLHDGPYYCRMQSDYKIYNLRQALFLNWIGFRNIFKHQPFHLIHEYFGSKIAFYFLFYGFYNMALLFMGLWGFFMIIMYEIRNMEFFPDLRSDFCGSQTKMRDGKFSPHLSKAVVACPDCHDQANTICPYSLNDERCVDFYLLNAFESPYVLFYSTGLSLMGILFVVFWKHNECYWRWMWEEYLPCCDRQLASCNAAMCRTKDKIKGAILNIVFPFIAWIMILVVMFFTTHYVSVEWLRPLAVTYKKAGKQAVPLMNRPLDYTIIALLAAITVLIFYAFERIFHGLSYKTTKNECHRTFAQFERALILKKFFYSVLFGTTLIVYFGWLKGAFYMSPQEGWNMTVAIAVPWKVYQLNLTKFNMYIRNVTFRAITLNCGPTSCLREALVALCVILFIRYVLIAIVSCIWRAKKLHKPQVPDLKTLKDKDKKKKKKKKKKDKKKKPMIETPVLPLPVQNPPQTTCEREYQLHRIKEREITKNYHSLFFQFLLVAYFTILFPVLPWLVMLRNIFDLRKKAKLYLLYSRRPILYKTAGIGFWNFIMKLICYGIPIAHAVTFLRMEMFKKYVFYKNYGMVNTKYLFTKFLYDGTHSLEINKNKWYAKTIFNKTGDLGYVADFNGTAITASICRFDGYYVSTKDLENLAWGVQWNYLTENFTKGTPSPDHYYLKFIKTITFLVYMHLFAALAVMAWHYLGSCPGEAARYIHRERILCRFHNHRLNYFGKRYRFQSKVNTDPLPPPPQASKTSMDSTDSNSK